MFLFFIQDDRLARALGTTLAEMFEEVEQDASDDE
jgi:hypothetical protein